MKITGIFLIIFGLALSAYTAISLFTKQVDLSVVASNQDAPQFINWSPFVGLAIMVVGAFLVVRARLKN
ncbi:MAG: hypothetical protein WCG93_14700 [Paludibacter sp.]